MKIHKSNKKVQRLVVEQEYAIILPRKVNTRNCDDIVRTYRNKNCKN